MPFGVVKDTFMSPERHAFALYSGAFWRKNPSVSEAFQAEFNAQKANWRTKALTGSDIRLHTFFGDIPARRILISE